MVFQLIPPAQLNAIAQSLVDSGNYAPSGGVTRCNLFLDAFASTAFGYRGFSGRDANACVDYLRVGGDGWAKLFDHATDAVEALQAAFQSAQDDANRGYLVVFGLRLTDESGHVAVGVAGSTTSSGSWAQARLPSKLPTIAQAGREVFCGKQLGYGITPDDYSRGDLVVFVRRG